MSKLFRKILIANRGEIAVRIARACKEAGITSAAVYSEADENAYFTQIADEAWLLGPATPNESYLAIDKIIKLAIEIGADAIHPGYGFLSENAEFIAAVEKSGITFVGPPSASVAAMGNKTKARTLMKKHGVPIVPGTTSPVTSAESAKAKAKEIGYPVLLKASAGGGGKGMKAVHKESELEAALESAKREAKNAFGNDEVYIEKLIVEPKHIEVQIIADTHGSYVHLLERDCSVQRRHQKVIEEAPGPTIDEEARNRVTEAAINAAKACGYCNAGTVEFLMDKERNFYFLEMNTRLQVEHPVTEMITGIDLVLEQIRIAAGRKLSFKQSDITHRGSAVEARLYAEDPDANFLPSIGTIGFYRPAAGPGIRNDEGVTEHSVVSRHYDPLLTKVIAWGATRKQAISRLDRALAEYLIGGVVSNIPFLRWILKHKVFISGDHTINFLDEYFFGREGEWKKDIATKETEQLAAVLAAAIKERGCSSGSGLRIKESSHNQWGEADYE